jgi:inosose dehydratase
VSLRLGTAPDSWGIWFPDDPKQVPWQRFLDEAQQAGYDAIELGPYGYLPTDPVALADELERRSIRLSGGFVGGRLESADCWSQVEASLEPLCSLVKALGGDYLGIIDAQYSDPHTAEIIAEAELTDEAWGRLVDSTYRIAEFAQRFGLTTLLHPHADTPVEYEAQIERFLELTDPAVVGLQFDVGHHAYRGGDPIDFLRRHHDRIKVIHLKSVDPEVSAKVNAGHIPWSEAVAMGIFTEPAKGIVDFRALKQALDEIRFEGWGIVEQDMYPAPPDKPLPIAERSYVYLRSLGY